MDFSNPDWWQVIVGTGGFVGLVWTIVLTNDSLNHARLSSRQELRAYLATDAVLTAGGGTKFTVVAKNYGQTPARSVVAWFDAVYDTADRRDFDRPPAAKEVAMCDVGPSQAIEFDHPIPSRPSIPDAFAVRRLWFFGEITYVDAFDEVRTTTLRSFRDERMAFQTVDGSMELEKGNRID